MHVCCLGGYNFRFDCCVLDNQLEGSDLGDTTSLSLVAYILSRSGSPMKSPFLSVSIVIALVLATILLRHYRCRFCYF